jgi:hypothetical protein
LHSYIAAKNYIIQNKKYRNDISKSVETTKGLFEKYRAAGPKK